MGFQVDTLITFLFRSFRSNILKPCSMQRQRRVLHCLNYCLNRIRYIWQLRQIWRMPLTAFSSHPRVILHITSYNQAIVYAVTEVLLWHVRCEFLFGRT